jgi:hypothetical protein
MRPGIGGPGAMGPGQAGPPGPGGGGVPPLHGQFVVADGNGGYTTTLTQTGTITAISDTDRRQR